MHSEKTHNILYSKRFPHQNMDEPPEGCELPEEILSAKPPVSSKAFLDRIMKGSTYLPNPDKIAKKDQFVSLATGLSERYEIDMDITDRHYFISVTMYLDHAYCNGELKALFAELLAMCDCISSFPSHLNPCGFILSLDYYTHDHYFPATEADTNFR